MSKPSPATAPASGQSRSALILRSLLGFAPDQPTAVSAYERDFAQRFGRSGSSALAFDHGRTALLAILKSLGVGDRDGDEVILSCYTCHTVPRTVRAAGATLVYVDIDPANFGPSAGCVARAVTARTKAILLQHSYGWPAAADAILTIARAHGIPVIEDGCQTLGAQLGVRRVGTLGVASFYSSQWNKPYSTGQGGMALVHDSELAERVRAWRERHARPVGFVARQVLAAELLAFEWLMFPRSAALLTRMFRGLSAYLPLPGGTDQDEGDAGSCAAGSMSESGATGSLPASGTGDSHGRTSRPWHPVDAAAAESPSPQPSPFKGEGAGGKGSPFKEAGAGGKGPPFKGEGAGEAGSPFNGKGVGEKPAPIKGAGAEPVAQLTGLQAALGRLEVARFDRSADHRRRLATRLSAALRDAGFDVPGEPPGATIVPLRLPVRVRDPLAAIAAARGYGFELTTWFDVPLDPLANYRATQGYQSGMCPLAEKAAREIVLIPLSRRVTDGVARRMERFFRDQRQLLQG